MDFVLPDHVSLDDQGNPMVRMGRYLIVLVAQAAIAGLILLRTR